MTVFKSESNYLKTAQSFLSQKIVPFEKDQISFYYPGNLPAVQLVKAGNALSRAESMSGKQASSWFSWRRREVARPFSATFRSPFSGRTYSSAVTSVAHVQLLSFVRSQVITTQPHTLCVSWARSVHLSHFLWNLVMSSSVSKEDLNQSATDN